MTPSSPQSRTIGTGEWSNMPTVVFKLASQDSIGPSDFDQSKPAISFAVVPPAAKKNDALWISPNHVEVYLATCTMTFQFKESKLREDAGGSAWRFCRIEEGDALDGPVGRRRSALRG